MSKIENFLDADGRLKVFPAKRNNKAQALLFLAEKFEKNRSYSGKEVNELLRSRHTFSDPATLRRELCDNFFLDREADGSNYRVSAVFPDIPNVLK